MLHLINIILFSNFNINMSLWNIAWEMAQALTSLKNKQNEVEKFTNKLKEIFNTNNVIFNKWNFFNSWGYDLSDSSFLIDWKILLIPNEDILDNNFFLSTNPEFQDFIVIWQTILDKAKTILDKNNITYTCDNYYM